MHTSSGVDNIDEYLETVDEEGRRLRLPLRHRGAAGDGDERSPCRTRPATGMAQKEFTVYRTHHGPIVREADGKWVSVRLMQEPLKALHAVVHRAPRRRTTRRSARRWSCTPTRRTTRSTPTPTATSPTSTPTSSRSATRSSTGPSRWTAAIPRPTGTACSSIDETPGLLNPAERLALQHEQLAVVGGRPEQPEEGGLSGVRGARHRGEPARRPRAPRARQARRTSRSTR